MMPVFRPHSSANVERMEFAKKLINLMRDKDLNQSDLARKAGLTRDAVSTYVRARSMPEPANLAKLANALGVEPSYFQLDYYRIAEKMATPEPFEPTKAAPTVDVPLSDDEAVTMKIGRDGKAVVTIRATMDVDKAMEFIAYFNKSQQE